MNRATKRVKLLNDLHQHALVNGYLQHIKKVKKGDKLVCIECTQSLIAHLWKATGNVTLQHYPDEAKNCNLTDKNIYYYVRLFDNACKQKGHHLMWMCESAECETELEGPFEFNGRRTFHAEMKERILTATTLETYCIKADGRIMKPSLCASCTQKIETESTQVNAEAARIGMERLTRINNDRQEIINKIVVMLRPCGCDQKRTTWKPLRLTNNGLSNACRH